MVRTFSLAAMIAIATLAVATQATTQQTTPPPPKPKIVHEPAKSINSLEGKDTFAAYCAVCHGPDAKGHGPAAPALKVPRPISRPLQSARTESFPVDVETKISGSDLPVHGTLEMPIWGPVFRSISKDRDIDTMRMKNLVKYPSSQFRRNSRSMLDRRVEAGLPNTRLKTGFSRHADGEWCPRRIADRLRVAVIVPFANGRNRPPEVVVVCCPRR